MAIGSSAAMKGYQALPPLKELAHAHGIDPKKIEWSNHPRSRRVFFRERFQMMTHRELERFKRWTVATDAIEVKRWGTTDRGETVYPELFEIEYRRIRELDNGD